MESCGDGGISPIFGGSIEGALNKQEAGKVNGVSILHVESPQCSRVATGEDPIFGGSTEGAFQTTQG